MNNIAFIGAGNMSRAIVSGLIKQGYSKHSIMVANPSPEKRLALAAEFGVRQTSDNIEAAAFADVIILAVKPHLITAVCQHIGQQVNLEQKSFISIAVGCTVKQIQQALTQNVPVVRAMPNTPAQLGLGVTGMYASAEVTTTQQAIIDRLMAAVGTVIWLDSEAMIDSITCISGSGPAYFFLFMEAMLAKAQQLGFSAQQSRLIVQQTALGAAQMVVTNDLPISQLRANVTSKGGTTQAAINQFSNDGLTQIVTNAMNAALHRAKEMAQNSAQ